MCQSRQSSSHYRHLNCQGKKSWPSASRRGLLGTSNVCSCFKPSDDRRCDDDTRRYDSLVSICEPVEVSICTLPNGNFIVRSFFSAVHAVLCRCLPPNQSIREYIEIFSLLTMLLSWILRPYLMMQATYHPKTNLLICLSPASPDESFALVGFSASAHPVVKEYVLK